MKLIKVAAACLNQTPFDWERNLGNIREAIRRARAEEVTVLCLPELCITGYGCEDAFFSPGLQEEAFAALESLLPDTKGMVVSFGLPLYYEKALYNAAAIVVDGATTEVSGVSAQVAGKRVVIYDDMIRTGGSLINAARAYKDAGASAIDAIATHGVFPADSIAKIKATGLFGKVVVTDSHPRAHAQASDFVEVQSVAPLLVEHLRENH